MKVLQIACGFSYSKIYYNYFKELKKRSTDFFVYVPRHKNHFSPMLQEELSLFESYTSEIIKPYDKFIYFTKIRRMTIDLEENVDLADISIIHAHSLFSDGAVALKMKRKYNIPYIVAIRDTDINQYYKKAIHLRGFATTILNEASNIIFLSNSYKDKLLNNYVPNKYKNSIMNKTYIIPNGINSFWLNNKVLRSSLNFSDGLERPIKLIFVGQVIRRKNIESIINAMKVLKKEKNLTAELTVVGKIKDQKYYNELQNVGEFNHINFVDKSKLIQLYRKSDIFIMPSFTETFGLVYAEAMTQGLPVIYSAGQGFDQQFEEGTVGYRVDPNDVNDIAQNIYRIFHERDKISLSCIRQVDKFDWERISYKYVNIYQAINNS